MCGSRAEAATASESRIDECLERHPDAGRDALIPILQEVQEACGCISPQAVVRIGRHLRLPASKVFGVATFYNQFRFHPPGRFHIQLCRGTACHVKNSAGVLVALQRRLGIEPGQTTRDGIYSLEVVACIGACGLAPVMSVNGEFYGGLSAETVGEVLEAHRREHEAANSNVDPGAGDSEASSAAGVPGVAGAEVDRG